MHRVTTPNPAMREAISDSGAQAHYCIPWRVINANRDLIQHRPCSTTDRSHIREQPIYGNYPHGAHSRGLPGTR
jgi:hypothetical protein